MTAPFIYFCFGGLHRSLQFAPSTLAHFLELGAGASSIGCWQTSENQNLLNVAISLLPKWFRGWHLSVSAR